ncbi:hypothetical protein [Parerythrobacter lacustris]|uniref:Mitochondrial inner membrane protein n=1 Tax=Parerythrobacter lacustris TaxID=2969984 RepID=A0ABT1XQH9_9SPHN|nr:hypothetical protein [Parerythrobacter lacustris]MCR2833176.1 hypothetical protein [Parerythrobacter lacustris]
MDDTIGTRRKSGSFQTILGLALTAILLGAVVTGYFWWRGDRPEQAVPAKIATSDKPKAPPNAMSEFGSAGDIDALASREEAAAQEGGLEGRLALAEARLARIDQQTQAASGNAGRAEGLLIAFAARRTLERGEGLGYLGDQLRLRFGMAQPDAVRVVLEASKDPIRLDQLIARLDGLEPTLVTPSEAPSFSRFRRELGELFVIRRESTPSTRSDRSIYRARLSLEQGRVEDAIKEVRTLPGAANAKQWIVDAKRYAAIQNALNILETSAIQETSGLRDSEGQAIDQPGPTTRQ